MTNPATCASRTLAFCVCVLAATVTTGSAEQGDLLWSDEFDSGTKPDSSKWEFDLGGGGWGNGELQVYTDSTYNVKVENGFLNIVAQKDETVSPPTFTSGRIKTEGQMSFKYGTLEARIKSPDIVAGLWPAFWTLGSNFQTVGWPASGEIDIMEIGQGGLNNNRVVSAAHWQYDGNYATYAKGLDSPTDLSQDFHLFRLEWTPFRLATFVNDALIWEMNIDEYVCSDCEELHREHFVLLNLAVGGGFTSGGSSSSSGGSSSSGCASYSSSTSSSSSGGCGGRGPEDITAPFPGIMLVDWIRLYDNGFTEVTLPNTSPPIPNPTYVQTPQPSTGAPNTAMPSTFPPTDPLYYTPVPTTKAPSTYSPTTPDRQYYTPEPASIPPTTKAPTPSPTRNDRQYYTPNPTTPARQPSYPTSFDDGDDGYNDYDDDYVDCVTSSRSESGSKGKGGKGGKSNSGSRRSGGKSGKAGNGASRRSNAGGKGGKGDRRRRLNRHLNSKGKGSNSRSSSGTRCRLSGQGRTGGDTSYSYLSNHASAAPTKLAVSGFAAVTLLLVFGICI